MSSNKITVIKAVRPSVVSKTFTLVDGLLHKNSIANITDGQASTHDVATAEDMANLLSMITDRTDLCICAGSWTNLPDDGRFRVVGEKELKGMLGVDSKDRAPGGVQIIDGKPVAARLKSGITPSAWVLLDADNPPGIPAEWAAMDISERLELWEPLLPGISTCERIELRSSSARVLDFLGGFQKPSSHAWIRVNDPQKIEVMRTYLNVQIVLQGVSFSYEKRSRLDDNKIVGIEHRSVFDMAVFDTGRLTFCSAPILGAGMDSYVVDDADITIFNEGGGELNLDAIQAPAAEDLRLYKEATGIALKVSVDSGSISVDSIGQLKWDTEIERRGHTKTLREWFDNYAGEKIRCESPFRESKSEAAFISSTADGEPFVHDVGNRTNYFLGNEGLLDLFESFDADTGKTVTGFKAVKDYAQEVISTVAYSLGLGVKEVSERIQFKPMLVNRIIESSAWHPDKSKFFIMSNGLKISAQTDFDTFIRRLFGSFYDSSVLSDLATEQSAHLSETKAKAFVKTAMGAATNKIMDIIKVAHQFTVIDLHVDPFAKHDSVKITDSVARLTFRHKPLASGFYDEAVINDYLEHFPEFEQLILLLVAARFANDRKQAHMWLQATSNWGKSFLLGCLGAHGLVVETSVSELDIIFKGGPVGKTMADFFRAWVLAVDEFKGVSREVKQISDTLPFAPKGMPTIRAPLYLKMFLSAEDVPSLANRDSGVEDQFANRFTHMSVTGRLDLRPLFMKDKGHYRTSLINYIGKVVNKEVNRYVELGASGAGRAADVVVSNFYKAYRIDRGEYRRMSEELHNLINHWVDWLTSIQERSDMFSDSIEGRRVLSAVDKEVSAYVVKDHKTEQLYLRSPSKIFELWVNSEFDVSQRKTIFYKKNEVLNKMGWEGKGYRVNGDFQKWLLLTHRDEKYNPINKK